MTLPTTPMLRRALAIDAVISGATGLLLVLASRFLASRLDLPETLLRYSGVVLIPFVLYVGFVSRREVVPRASVFAIVALNVAWVVASAWLAFGDLIHPNALGYAFIAIQGVTVAAFAEVQYVALRRAGLREPLVPPTRVRV